jgi:hypothetical protein
MPVRQLMLTRIKCDIETDEDGNDSPYIMVFMGLRSTNSGVPSSGKLIRVRHSVWDEAFHNKKAVDTQIIIDQAEAGGFFVFATLIEEDWDPDLASGGWLQTLIMAQWLIYGGAGWANLTSSQLQEIMRGKIATLMKAALANDEYIQTRSFVVPTVTTDTTLPTLSYSGDGGVYKLTFGVRIKGG